jgi:hypothetical protein
VSSVEHGSSQGVTRRQALKKGALTGAAIVWTVPVVQSIGMSAAHADEPSTDVLPTKTGTTEAPPSGPAPGGTEVLGTQQGALAHTGADVPVARVAATAAASVAVGGALIAASRKQQRASSDEE